MNLAFSMNKAVRLTRKMLFNPFSLKSWFFWALAVMLATGQYSITLPGDFSSTIPFAKNVAHNFFVSDDSSSLPPSKTAGVIHSENPDSDISTTPDPSKIAPSTPTKRLHQNVIKFIISIVFILVFLPLWLILYYIKCRFRFVLIDQCTRGTDAILQPFREYRKEAKSFFKGLLLLVAIAFVTALVSFFCLGIGFGLLNRHPGVAITLMIIVFSIDIIVLSIFSVLIQGYDSLGPVILYSDRSKFWQSFKKYLGFWRKHFGSLLAFGILKVLIYFSFFILILLSGILTFNIAFCLLIIPLVGIMIFLPFYIFNQMFTLDFCNSLLNNPDWDSLEKQSQRHDTTPLTDIASNSAE